MIKLVRSFGYAWQGILYCIKTQLNFRIHLVVLSMVIIGGFILHIGTTEWLFIIGCAMLVLALELLNTAIEKLCDTISTEIQPEIKIIKDVSAAAVLLSAAGSVVTGIIIFFPKMMQLFK
ncbi:MAG: diacylglycerol kinase family protein [Sediminibacterium sp.]